MFLPKLTPLAFGLGICGAGLALSACSGDSSSALDDDAGTADADTDGGDGDSEAGDESAEEGGDTGEPGEDRPARGISITQVEANQGTAIFIGEGGEWVDGPERLGPLVRDRDTLIRVHYEVDPAFTPREIQARLELQFPDGAQKTLVQTREVDGPSAPNVLDGTFFFGLVADFGEVSPGTRYQVELHEVAEGAGAGEAEGVWQTPPQPEIIGIQPEPMELEVVFVPYHHLWEDIDRMADTSESNMKVITDYLYEHNPASELIWELHEPVLWELPMENLGSVLGPMSALRDSELAPPNVYYHALFPVPGGGVAGVAGVASVPGDGKGEGLSRVAVSALGNNVFGTAGVVVHEVGHNEGLQHVFCPFAQAASPDPSYHDPDGLLRGWGFGLISFQLYAPDNHYDYMSYCGPSWVSRWSWSRTFNRIRTLTSWKYESPGAGGLDYALGPAGYAEKPLLLGSINGDGSEFWWTAHGTLPSDADPYGADYDHHIELRGLEGELVDTLPGVVRYTNDYSTAWIIAELPDSLARLDGVEEIVRIDDAQQAHVVTRDRVQLSPR